MESLFASGGNSGQYPQSIIHMVRGNDHSDQGNGAFLQFVHVNRVDIAIGESSDVNHRLPNLQ